MMKAPTHHRIDTNAFARNAQVLQGSDALPKYERLVQELPAQAPASALQRMVDWQATGEWRVAPASAGVPWLHLHAEATLPLQCQRCLLPVDVAVAVDRSFRFVSDEQTAEAEDDESEEDVLVDSREFDLDELVEDEVLMALPLVPRHDVCPTEVTLSVEDPEFAAAIAEKPHPFAALQKLKKDDDH